MSFLSFFSQKENKKLLTELNQRKEIILSGIGNITAKTFLLADFFKNHSKSILYIIDDDQNIKKIEQDLNFWIGVNNFKVINLKKNKVTQMDLVDCLFQLNNQHKILVIKSSLLKEKFPSVDFLLKNLIKVKKGDEFSNVEIFNALIKLGYSMSHDVILQRGEYRRSGGVLNIFPLNSDKPFKIEIEQDKVVNILEYNQINKKVGISVNSFDIYPLVFNKQNNTLFEVINNDVLTVFDEVGSIDNQEVLKTKKSITFTDFPQTEQNYFHLRYLSVLKFYNLTDFLNDIRSKIERKWKIAIFSRRMEEIKNIFIDEKIPFTEDITEKKDFIVHLINARETTDIPVSFQNPVQKIELITDKEIFSLRKINKNKSLKKLSLEFLSSLKEGDFVVHLDHGIGRFLGIIQREINNIAREYLEINYAENDKLFVPIDQADKINKYISGEESEDNEPKLSRLGSQEWKNITSKIKKETEKIAKELLQLYAKRSQAKGHIYKEYPKLEQAFAKDFPYEETPGQLKAIQDTHNDMSGEKPMDRLICGDVGFGKTEVAMRVAFKAVLNKKQVAFISPITILTDQHYRSFKKRMSNFDVKIEMLSRFKTQKEQREIIKKLTQGKIDIVIGTHRLLQPDVKFLDLGVIIIDEEQRFGVKQKEILKNMRSSVDILTLTATPIPRTLNLSLNKLRDITIITTPPPGRLPIITEVRKYSNFLIRESILKELKRKGQVYFLHNRVETIEGMAHKLRMLVPEARFIVTHGQLNSGDLESRIIQFKEHKFDVLISSTIIENGIDLANANTLIVNNAERFGLSQLYQLRGRIGRGKSQAFAYLLYHTQKLKEDAKKRLRAIVEASELGSGFQIAMRDLEIRGAGEILGANQHGMMNIVGVGHFIRLLNQTIADMKSGKRKEKLTADEEVVVELPIEAYIPNFYIADPKEKIAVYQKLSAVDNHELLEELFQDLEIEYGKMPKQIKALFKILDIKLLARQAGLTHIKAEIGENKGKEIALYLSNSVTAKNIVKVLEFNDTWRISGNKMKIDIQKLGFNWLDDLKDNIKQFV